MLLNLLFLNKTCTLIVGLSQRLHLLTDSYKTSATNQEGIAILSAANAMAKKKPGQVPNRHIYTRISFLYQAAVYSAQISNQDSSTTSGHHSRAAIADAGAGADADADTDTNMEREGDRKQDQASSFQDSKHATIDQNVSRKFLTDMRAITQKSVIRAGPHIKRSICKYCDTLLIDGQTSSSVVENNSKGAKKPWADVLVIKCHTCGRQKRFPVNAPSHKRRQLREPKNHQNTAEHEAAPSHRD